MNTFNWNAIIQALVLIRIGQELGTDSRLARALHEVVQALMFARRPRRAMMRAAAISRSCRGRAARR